MQRDSAYNFRAVEFLLLRATVRCPHCQRATRVQAVALPPGHAACTEEQDEAPGDWQTVPLPVVLFCIDALDADAAQTLATRGAQLQSPAPGEFGWRNRCEHCHGGIDDDELHAEPGAAFMPRSAQEAAAIMLEFVHQPLRVAAAGASLDPPWFADLLHG